MGGAEAPRGLKSAPPRGVREISGDRLDCRGELAGVRISRIVGAWRGCCGARVMGRDSDGEDCLICTSLAGFTL